VLGQWIPICVVVAAGWLAPLLPGALFTFGLITTSIFLLIRPKLKPFELWLDEQYLHVGKRRYPRSVIRNAYVVPGRPPSVGIERTGLGQPIQVVMAGEDQAHQLLDALGWSARRRVAVFRGLSLVHGLRWNALQVLGAVGYFVGVLGLAIVLALRLQAPSLILLAVIVAVAPMMVPASVQVGVDGVLLRWLGTRRFIRHDDIQALQISRRGFGDSKFYQVQIALRNGQSYLIPLPSTKQWGSDEQSRSRNARSLVARIEEAQRAARLVSAGASATALQRHGRTAHDWLLNLRAALKTDEYRAAALLPARLWQIIEDAAGEAADRAAAAAALGGTLASADRERLRRVAATTAAPKLRVAFDAILEDHDEEAIAQALLALDEDGHEDDQPRVGGMNPHERRDRA